jgi:precorrin-2 dehydrogenase/sirohydrochlorin ferrochelatase
MHKKKTTSLPYYPIFLNLQGKKCVVVGGGEVALRKVERVLESGADVTVVSPSLDPGLAQLAKRKTIHLIQRNYRSGDLKGAAIVIAATDIKETNYRVAEEAKKVKALVNLVDDPEPSDFIVPSFFRKGDLTVAVSTGGQSPALARKVRIRLEKTLGEDYALLASLIGDIRRTLKTRGITVDAESWQEALDIDPLIQLIQSGQEREAKAILLKSLMSHAQRASSNHENSF